MLDFKSFEMVITVGFALKVKQVNLKFFVNLLAGYNPKLKENR